MKQIMFFASGIDLHPVLEMVERSGRLKYIQTGNSDRDMYEELSSGTEIPGPGICDSRSSVASRSYLVANYGTPIAVREIALNTGEQRFAIDQLLNPHTVILTPGGRWTGDILIRGHAATASDSEESRDLMKRFGAAFRKNFCRVKSFWIGPEALKYLEGGARLTADERSPQEYDLSMRRWKIRS